ncbi:hypothetical protein FA13DRAFT_1746159, partial [Coprinellus micaceus]
IETKEPPKQPVKERSNQKGGRKGKAPKAIAKQTKKSSGGVKPEAVKKDAGGQVRKNTSVEIPADNAYEKWRRQCELKRQAQGLLNTQRRPQSENELQQQREALVSFKRSQFALGASRVEAKPPFSGLDRVERASRGKEKGRWGDQKMEQKEWFRMQEGINGRKGFDKPRRRYYKLKL